MIFRPAVLLPLPIDSGAFLPEMVIFPELSGRFRSFPEVGVIALE
jgi:hypothetical protein